MVKRLTKHGNSLALVIDKPVLDLLKIDAETDLELRTDGELLVIGRVKNGHDGAFERALREVNQEYGGVLKKLAK